MPQGLIEGLPPDRRPVMPDEKAGKGVAGVRKPFADGAGDFGNPVVVFEDREGRSGFGIGDAETLQDLEGRQENLAPSAFGGKRGLDRVDMEDGPGLGEKAVNRPVYGGFRGRATFGIGGGEGELSVEGNPQDVFLGEDAFVTAAGGDQEIRTQTQRKVSGRSLHPSTPVEAAGQKSETGLWGLLSHGF